MVEREGEKPMKRLIFVLLMSSSLAFGSTEDKIKSLEFQTKEIGLEIKDLKKSINELSVKTDNQIGKMKRDIERLSSEIEKLNKKRQEGKTKQKQNQKEKEKASKIVVVNVANIRAKPDLKSPVIAKAYKGMEVKVLGETRYFYKVQLGNIKGYIYKTLLASPFLP